MTVTIRPMRAEDADRVLAVYQAGIDTDPSINIKTWETIT